MKSCSKTAAIGAGDTATLEIEPTGDWPEPDVPQDFETALAAAPQKIQGPVERHYADGRAGNGFAG